MLPELKLENGQVPPAIFANALAAANYASKEDQKSIYTWLTDHHTQVPWRLWNKYYGFLLHRLHCSCPLSTLAALLTCITTKQVVTQGRINMVASLYAQNLSPALSALLQAMRAAAVDSAIYVPSTGQSSVLAAKIPAKAAYKLCKGGVEAMSMANTELKRQLHLDAVEALVGAAPLVAVGGKVTLAIEEFVYTFLSQWNGSFTPVLLALVPLFKFWPVTGPVLQKRILEPLQKANSRSAASIIPELHWFGSLAEETVRLLAKNLESPEALVHVVHFYQVTNLQPPANLLYQIIYSLPGGLALCNQWAESVPQVCAVLQGQTNYPSSLIPEHRFVIANTPWIGTFASETFEKHFGKPSPNLFTLDTFELLNIDFEMFCNEVIAAMTAEGFYIEPYLYVQD